MGAFLTPGLHDIPAEIYHADPCERPSLSSTIAKAMLAQSPLHGWTLSPRLNPQWEPVEKKTFDIGRAAHRAILGKGGDFVEIPADTLAANGAASTKAAKEFVEQARAAGLTPLKGAEVEQIETMRRIAVAKLDAHRIRLDAARSEITALAEIDGTMCRAMIDNAPSGPRSPLYDFKTTTDANPEAAIRAVMTYGYDVQAAHYLDTWRAATGEDRAFRFIFQEKEAPFDLSVVELDAEALVMARKKIARARELWRDCLAADSWPGYPVGVHVVPLPAFFHERWLERESVEADHKRQFGKDIYDLSRRWQSPEGISAAE